MKNFPKRWISRKSEEIDRKIFSKLNYSSILIKILANRGIKTEQQILSFLKPSLKYLHNPELLPGIDKAISRIKKAINSKENILVFGDYDTDGIISSVLVHDFLKKLGLDVDIYIPNRFEEGYDINLRFVKEISKKKNYNLIICVDCGTNSIEVQKYICKSNAGIEVIVCDHHQPSNIVEEENVENNQQYDSDKSTGNYIIINPKLKYSRYPFKDLSGAGVTFKFIIAILRALEDKFKRNFDKSYLTTLLDMVAISTIADIMPLIDENRIMVKRGLEILKNTANMGLKKMLEILLKGKPDINTYDIGFIIAPRLNAEGRVATAKDSINLLKGDGEDLEGIVRKLDSFNKKRQNIQQKILEEIISGNDFLKIATTQKIFIDKSASWNEGVLGIVASDLVKRFNVPVILFKEKKDKLKGSGRSIESFSLYENLFKVRHLFEKFGGHEKACGITMDKDKFDIFRKEMIKIACGKIKDSDIEKKFCYDLEISFKDLNGRLIKELRLLHPFGVGNPKPVFATKDCTIIDINYLKDEKHVRLKLRNSNILFSAVMFGIDENVKQKIKFNNNVSILYNIEEDLWKDQNTIQLVILDIF